jgi:hypothetical protein
VNKISLIRDIKKLREPLLEQFLRFSYVLRGLLGIVIFVISHNHPLII